MSSSSSYASFVQKATSSKVEPPKRKHVRNIILQIWSDNSSIGFWFELGKRSLESNDIHCWKALITIHSILHEGPPATLSEAYSRLNLFQSLKESWSRGGSKIAALISPYTTFLIDKLKMHHNWPQFSPDFSLEKFISQEKIKNFDAEKMLQASNHLLDLQQSILSVQAKLFEQKDLPEYKVYFLIPLVTESYNIYSTTTYLIRNLVEELDNMDVLSYLVERFYQQHMELRSFYNEVALIKVVTAVIAVPTLPQNPPEFFASKSKSRTKKEAAKPKKEVQMPPPQPEPQPVKEVQTNNAPLINLQANTNTNTNTNPFSRNTNPFANPFATQQSSQQWVTFTQPQPQIQQPQPQPQTQPQPIQQQTQPQPQQSQQQGKDFSDLVSAASKFKFDPSAARKLQEEKKKKEEEEWEKRMAMIKQRAEAARKTSEEEAKKKAMEDKLREEEKKKEEQERLKREMTRAAEAEAAKARIAKEELDSEIQKLKMRIIDLENQLKAEQESHKATKEELERLLRTMQDMRVSHSSQIEAQSQRYAVLEAEFSRAMEVSAQQREQISVSGQQSVAAALAQLTHAQHTANAHAHTLTHILTQHITHTQTHIHAAAHNNNNNNNNNNNDNDNDDDDDIQTNPFAAEKNHTQQYNNMNTAIEKILALFNSDSNDPNAVLSKAGDAINLCSDYGQTAKEFLTFIGGQSLYNLANKHLKKYQKSQLNESQEYSPQESQIIQRLRDTKSKLEENQKNIAELLKNLLGVFKNAPNFHVPKTLPPDADPETAQQQKEDLEELREIQEKMKSYAAAVLEDRQALQQVCIDAKHIDKQQQGKETQAATDLEEFAEKELIAAAKIIEAAAKTLLDAKNARTNNNNSNAPDVNGAILDAAIAISSAVQQLILAATAAQQERVQKGRDNPHSSLYKRDPMWAQGLISAAKQVAAATSTLVTTANDAVNGVVEEERLVASSKGVLAATAQLVAATRAKSDPSSPTQTKLSEAAKILTRATQQLVEAAKAAARAQQEKNAANEIQQQVESSEFGSKIKEIEIQTQILKLEKELESARSKLFDFRKQRYH